MYSVYTKNVHVYWCVELNQVVKEYNGTILKDIDKGQFYLKISTYR